MSWEYEWRFGDWRLETGDWRLEIGKAIIREKEINKKSLFYG
jgi:hypothetical protein